MKAYRAFLEGVEDGITVVAISAKEAKKLAWPVLLDYYSDAEYIDLRVKQNRAITVPEDITEPTVYESCEAWNCAMWDFQEPCETCICRFEKLRQAEKERKAKNAGQNSL